MKICVVTASTDPERARPCIRSWGGHLFVGVVNGRPWQPQEKAEGEPQGALVRSWLLEPSYLGTVPAFRVGVDYALSETDADIIALLHDDVEILDEQWAEKVLRHFERTPVCGLLGFGGAIGLGSDDLYQTKYDPMQLARIGFRSNLVDAEVHGSRSLLAERVACLDGFSQIGRRAFWEGWGYNRHQADGHADPQYRPLTYLEDHGLVHHLYDSLLGAIAARGGWETWFLPIRCRHLGGQTAVGDRGYQAWAMQQIPGGDHGFWEQSHKRGYELFRDVLPLRV
jgi:hypothetical protein